MIAKALLMSALISAGPAPGDRAELARSFACPPGAELDGAAPPDGFETWCERVDDPAPRRRQGPARTWYDDGGLERAASFDHGLLVGELLEWHRNGKLARSGSFVDGERDGTWTIFFEAGGREERCDYARGQRHGSFESWWPNGEPRARGRYCHGLQCGTWMTWDESGRELGRITYEEIRATP